MKNRTALIFCLVLGAALYFGKPKEPILKKPKQIRMISTPDMFPEPKTVELPDYKNHYHCNNTRCPLL